MKNTLVVLFEVLKQPRYFLFSAATTLVLLLGVAVFSNVTIVSQVIFSTDISLLDKLFFILSLFGIFESNYSLLSAVLTILTVVLLSINLSLLLHYIRRRRGLLGGKKAHAAGIVGIVSGVFGIGCAACGSIIISSALSLVGAGGLLALLPFGGTEFGMLSVLLLLFSIYQISGHVNDPLVCAVE